MAESTHPKGKAMASIWLFALGYFACYVPYTALTKSVSKGLWEGMPAVPGARLLPVTTMMCLIFMIGFLAATGWWKHASKHKVGRYEVPGPTRWTLLSGTCTAVIITTTTLAYTFSGVSIVFVMLLMRGGVLSIAPLVDLGSGRKPKMRSWLGLLLCLAALLVAFAEEGGYDITGPCLLNIGLYITAYFFRLRFMSRLAKSDDPAVTKRYFAEEQLVATPLTLLTLGAIALWGGSPFMAEVRAGFLDIWSAPNLGVILLIGVMSQAVGIFGTLIFLDKSDNTFAVPVNRCSSILAGVVAGTVIALAFDQPLPSGFQLAGAGLVIVAIAVLSLPGLTASLTGRKADQSA